MLNSTYSQYTKSISVTTNSILVTACIQQSNVKNRALNLFSKVPPLMEFKEDKSRFLCTQHFILVKAFSTSRVNNRGKDDLLPLQCTKMIE